MRVLPSVSALLAALPALAVPAQAQHVFRHVVIIYQENRTPDNLFGSNPHFEPKVDIVATGVNSRGQKIPLTPEPLAGCYDPSHGHAAFEDMVQYGADRVSDTPQTGCTLPAQPNFKYADNSTGDVQPYFDLATNYGFANRMFQTNEGPSFPAHQFIFSGTSAPSPSSPLFAAENPLNKNEGAGCTAPSDQTAALIDGYGSETSNPPTYPCYDHNTMADVLDAAHIDWRYYDATATGLWAAPNAIQHICQPALVDGALKCEGPDWTDGSVVATNPSQVLTDIGACKLASVSWVNPTSANSDHASINNGTGPQWVASVVNAIGQQPTCPKGENYWTDTAIFITWDDWGGWYDHVPPPSMPLQPTSSAAWGDGYTYGLRVPLLVVSAYTPSGYVDDTVHDSGSLLYFIERNFHLGFIGSGQTIYDYYADYQAAARHDTMANFFPLTQPRPFVAIATALPADYFRHLPPSNTPVDND
jgi:phospholipase C